MCSHTQCHLLFCPEVRHQLHFAERSLSGWFNIRPSQSHLPWSVDLMFGVAYVLRRRGFAAMAIGVILAFDCYLRPSELCLLRVCDIIFAPHPTSTHVATLLLSNTKTAKEQSVVVRSWLLYHLLLRAVRDLAPDSRVFPFLPSSFRYHIRRSLAHPLLELSHLHLTPHGLRRGGVVHDYLLPTPLPTLQVRGRWRVTQTLQLYLQIPASPRLRLTVPAPVQRRLTRLQRDLPRFFNVPAAGGAVEDPSS